MQLRHRGAYSWGVVGSPAWGAVGEFAIVGAGFAALATLSSHFVVESSRAAIVWPPNGLIVGLAVVRPRSRWPWILLAIVPGELWVDLAHGVTVTTSLGWAAANIVESACAITLVLVFAGRQPRWESERGVCALIGGGALAPAAGAVVGSSVSTLAYGSSFTASWVIWWAGDATGLMLLLPLVVVIFGAAQKALPTARVLVGFFGEQAMVGAAVWVTIAFFPTEAPFLLLLPLALIGLHGRLEAVAIAVAAVGFAVGWLTARGVGPFAAASVDSSRMTLVAAFVAVSSLIGLSIAASLAERRTAYRALAAGQALQRAQAARTSKMEVIGQLAGCVAHDFNNLLTAIQGYAYLAREQTTDTGLRNFVDEILGASRRGAELTHQLLALSRHQTTPAGPVDLNAVVSETQNMLGQLTKSNVAVETVLQAAPGFVLGDAGQLSRVLVNLIVNAFEAMQHGGRLAISTSDVRIAKGELDGALEPGAYVRLSVADTGAGMNDETRRRVFEPFFTTKSGTGTGLGLSAVYGIVAQSGGHITVESEPGEGTEFNVYLPATDAEPALESAVPMTQDHGGAHVLLVDDEPSIRELLTETLERSGYTVTCTGDPEHALTLCTSEATFDVIVTDIMMPKLSGPELVAAATQHVPHLKAMYISGYVHEETQHTADAGVYLQKPFTPDVFKAKLDEILALTGNS